MVQSTSSPLSSVLRELTLASPMGSIEGGEVESERGGRNISHDASLVSGITQSSAGVSTPSPSGAFNGNEPPRGESSLITRSRIQKTTTGLRKYRLWCFDEAETDVCLGILGQGSLLCTIKNCKKNHRSNQQHIAVPGELYVAKTSETAFVEPCVKTSVLGDELLQRWKEMSCTLEEWGNLFNLVSSDNETKSSDANEVKFSAGDLHLKDQEEHIALSFKTPRKRKQIDMLQNSVSFQDFSTAIRISDQYITQEDNKAYISELNDRTVNFKSSFEKFMSEFEKERASSLSYYESNDLRLNRVKVAIGSKPQGMDERFDSPNIWLTLGTVAEEVTKLSDIYFTETQSLKKEVDKIVGHTETKLSQDLLLFKARLAELEAFAVESARKLQGNIVTLSSQINVIKPSAQPDNSRVLQRLENLEKEMLIVRSANDSSAIKYTGLGFRSQKESDAWVEINQPSDDYGLVMDFNCVMEHVWTQIVGQKILSNLEKVYKMKLRSNNQAVTLTSYETRIPKFFVGESRSLGVVKEGESYFKMIKSWEDWNTPNDGFRDQLKNELTVFDLGHSETIESELEPLTVFHSLVSKTLADSITWANKLIKFIDDTYREYSRARYGTKKAWHVTTKLAVALMEYISTPRTVVYNSFRVNNHLAVSKTVTFSFLRSLDLMVEIEKLQFKNSPIITSELAKFLALNSNYESVEELQKEVKGLNEGISKALKEASSAVKSVGTVGNTADKTLKEITILSKRVKTLESK